VDYLAWSPDGRTLAMVCNDDKIDLWDAVTGTARSTLVGHSGGGLSASFHPAGTLLASNGYESRLRLWDAILGQPLLSVTGIGCQFSRDGRIVIRLEDRLNTYRFEPALEYWTFAHADREPMGYRSPSIHPDGRILAAGADRGLVLWDLADGKELAFLPIGLVWGPLFEPSGDLITFGSIGVQRWPIRLDAGRDELKIGPPRRLPLPESACGLARDRSGRIVAAADHTHAYVAAPGRTVRVGPLDDCRDVAVSPDGRWLATGSHTRGVQVWRIDEAIEDPAKEATKVADLPIEYHTTVSFTPDGKWLVAGSPRLRLWRVGTWREEGEYTGRIGCFSPDGRTTAIAEPTRILRLVEFATGRTLARLESPDLGGVHNLAFSPDGSRLVLGSSDRPAPSVRVWDLRAIRKDLAGLGLDWQAPAYPEPDPTAATGPRSPLKVDIDLGAYRGLDEEAWAVFRQAGDLQKAGRLGEAIDVLRRTVNRSPDLALAHNSLAWLLAKAPLPHRRGDEAVAHARRAVELAPDQPMYLNTHGVALYRAGRFAEAVSVLERSLAAGIGNLDGFDLFFLAMAHHRLGHGAAARECFDRALAWARENPPFPQYARELRTFRDEARAVLAGPADELPDDIFAAPR
jgi:WD40 repeat protein